MSDREYARGYARGFEDGKATMSRWPEPALRTGTFYRLIWDTGRTGRWHRARSARPSLSPRVAIMQRCRCGVPVAWYRHRDSVVVETRPDRPALADSCWALRADIDAGPAL